MKADATLLQRLLAGAATGLSGPPGALMLCGDWPPSSALACRSYTDALTAAPSGSPVWLLFRGAGPGLSLSSIDHPIELLNLSRSGYSRFVHALPDNLRAVGDVAIFELPTQSPEAPIERTHKVLVTSTYDESRPSRLSEYVDCVRRNAKNFDLLLFAYERSKNTFAEEVAKLYQRSPRESTANVLFLDIEHRPTFAGLFDTADYLFSGDIVAIANADIAFDESLSTLTPELIADSFLVLSRYESDEQTAGGARLIEDHHGISNTMSADAWLYLAPRVHRFRAEFAIGTYQCDSFLNYHISRSGYQTYNPCLSIRTLHVHDPAFNSSKHKADNLAPEITSTLNRETLLNDGISPVCGVQWCRLEHLKDPALANQTTQWASNVACIDVKPDGSNLFAVMVVSLMLVRIMSNIPAPSAVWIRASASENPAGVLDALLRFRTKLSDANLNVGPASKIDHSAFLTSPKNFHRINCNLEDVTQSYLLTCGIIEDTLTPLATQACGDGDPRLLCDVGAIEVDKSARSSLVSALIENDRRILQTALVDIAETGSSWPVQEILQSIGCASS